ncbi:xanthine dehydrogenase small subunit [Siculibacillus lacustris]|uniref:Xanthine dehydrogenase small subunit n=1 Tax=Siculibacillus lacustris TaxID=1549641 RepID=A0A4Q9VNF4_9HYPH|nr:xanthine dehydrogenase small subunit [Siculibacillus lacustris]TBW37188.1 xanthine dehydrogenase small subunit [Siculibacillus lacustris]
MTVRRSIRYLSKGRVIEVADFAPTATLLDHLRLERRLVGTKEGCAEGDCGACTVALGRLVDGRLVYEPINACIRLLGTVDGCEVVTIEDLAEGGVLHPLQQAMVRRHASQCGFCTPGIVMSLFTLYATPGRHDRDAVIDRLSGNLCRCTGYRPIVDAALEACDARPDQRPDDLFAAHAAATAVALAGLTDAAAVFVGDETRFFAAPHRLDTLADILEACPDATLVAGATDVGLWITKAGRDLPRIVHLGRIAGLDRIEETAEGLSIGATVSLAAAAERLAAWDPDLAHLFRRIGSVQVRASGTLGGNIANGSPIGDSPPALIALDASLELWGGGTLRQIPLERFFLAYGRQDRRPGEIVTRVVVPRLEAHHAFRAYKIAKRHDQDISSVMAALRLTLDGDRITEARLAFGGMAGTPMRAAGAEAALVGASLRSAGGWRPALDALRGDFTPLTDMRASADYRMEAAVGLLGRALAEIAGTPSHKTRVFGLREEVGHDAHA